MRQLTELDIYILKQEFPHLSLTEDPDIERYFEFRSLNRQREALQLYNTKLVHRYPDSKLRVALMTYYRKRDYRFRILLTDSLAQLAERTIVQVKRVIAFFARTVTPLKNAKVYTIIQVCEKIINAISPDRFAAIEFIEKYARYAEKLNYYAVDMQQAADIIRMYITDTISSVREFREELNQKNAQEKTLRVIRKSQDSVVDFSKIVFTKKQIDAITIPSSISRVEDKVLAYTMKYWSRCTDSAFENMLLLYSRKYGTNHYAVFHAIKIGKLRNWKDEELLHAVLANVAQGYYYNIAGDLYLQRLWKQVRLKIEAAAQVKALPAPTVKKIKPVKRVKQQIEKAAAKVTAKVEKTVSAKYNRKEEVKNIPVNAVSSSEITTSPSKKVFQTAAPVASELKKNVRAVALDSMAEVETPLVKSVVPSKPVSNQPAVNRREAVKSAAGKTIPEQKKVTSSVQIYPINSPKELPMSIAETVKKASGKSYSIYRDLFFKEVRSAIRTILQHSAIQKLSFFGGEQNNAENIIYQFLETNYDNPYQQWQGSKEQAEVFEQGFRIESLEPIIRLWAKENI